MPSTELSTKGKKGNDVYIVECPNCKEKLEVFGEITVLKHSDGAELKKWPWP
jgi:hypothetical protein